MTDANDLQEALGAPSPTQSQIIETWLALIEAQKAAAQAAQAAEARSRAAYQAERARTKLVEAGFEEIERLKRLEPQISTMIQNYQTFTAAILGMDEKMEDLHARQGVIDEKIKLILEIERARVGNIRDPGKRKELEGKIEEAQELSLEAAGIKRRLSKQLGNLQYLQEQAASYGAGRVPLEIINQIADTQEQVQQLQVELKQAVENG